MKLQSRSTDFPPALTGKPKCETEVLALWGNLNTAPWSGIGGWQGIQVMKQEHCTKDKNFQILPPCLQKNFSRLPEIDFPKPYEVKRKELKLPLQNFLTKSEQSRSISII